MRGIAAGGRPCSTISLVGSTVAGSIVSTQTPSKDMARRKARAAANEKSRTPRLRCMSQRISARARLRGLACTHSL
jgi:hypothetical protein